MDALCFTAEAEALGKALRDVRQVVERANTIPILNNVLIESMDGAVRVTANNLTVSASREVPATIGAAGAITVPAHRFTDVVSAMERGAQVKCDVTDTQVVVTSGRSRFRFAMLPARDFPKIAFGDNPVVLELPAQTLRDAFSTVRHAISTEETRYYLNGVFVHVHDGKLRFAATDGTRLARVALDPPDGIEGLPDTIIGTEAVSLILKASDGFDGTVQLEVGADKVRFTAGALTIVAKAVDGTYPDYARVIPNNNDVVLEIDRDALDTAVSRVLLANDEKSRSIKIALEAERAVVTSATAQIDGREEVPCTALLPRGPAQYGFNGRFMRDALAALDVDALEFRFAGPKDQTLVTSKARPDATLVLMPMFI